MTGEEFDDRILREARQQHEHDQRLAEIEADRARVLAEQDRRRAESWHTMLTWVVFIVGVLLALGTIVSVVTWNVTDDRRHRAPIAREEARVELERVRIAETCIREGNIWHADNCLITRRESP